MKQAKDESCDVRVRVLANEISSGGDLERSLIMNRTKLIVTACAALAGAVLGAWVFQARVVFAHCDTLDGPVVTGARSALDKGDVTVVLKWVKKEHEQEIKAAFEKALVVRSLGAEAKTLADTYFFETLVRVHREGEGAPYTGLKPAGEIEPPVASADKAIAAGSVDALARKIGEAAEKGVRERFARLMKAMERKDESVEDGRQYVAAYVAFVHYVEGLHDTITAGAAHGHEAKSRGH